MERDPRIGVSLLINDSFLWFKKRVSELNDANLNHKLAVRQGRQSLRFCQFPFFSRGGAQQVELHPQLHPSTKSIASDYN